MGEANMAYVHGDIPKAIRICQEVITNGKINSYLNLKIIFIFRSSNGCRTLFNHRTNL
jgi:hypothetical protein